MNGDHYARPNKLLGLDPEVRCEKLERELTEAMERIKQLEDQIFRAKKQREIANKVVEEISREEPNNKKIVALLNQHFWGLV